VGKHNVFNTVYGTEIIPAIPITFCAAGVV
jgi:hypothetical protein